MKKQKKLFPDLDGPKYGIPFKVIGFQAQTVNGTYTELIETEPKEMIVLKTRKDYIKWKGNLSDQICNEFNKMLKTKWDKIISFKVRYLCETDDHFV